MCAYPLHACLCLETIMCHNMLDMQSAPRKKESLRILSDKKKRKIELIMHLQCLFAIHRRRVPLLLRNTSKPRVPLHFQYHLIACAASSSSNSRLFSISGPRNPTVPALITFQEIKTGTRPYKESSVHPNPSFPALLGQDTSFWISRTAEILNMNWERNRKNNKKEGAGHSVRVGVP